MVAPPDAPLADSPAQSGREGEAPAEPVRQGATATWNGARRLGSVLNWLEMFAALALTLVIVDLHDVFRLHAGGLWRDEVNTVQLATLPSLAQTWENLQFDSFPILIFTVFRGWAAVFSTDDVALRALGMLLGLTLFGALWLNARLIGQRSPLLALALLGCNPLFIRYADSLRAYGLGMLLMLLTFGAVWRVVESLRPGRVFVAVVLAMLSVQCLYYNAVLLFSMCAAGALTAAWERDWKRAAAVLGIGGPAALSLLPYRETIHRLHEWNFLVQYPVSLPWIWKKLSDVTGAPDPLGVWVWTFLFLSALALAGFILKQGRDGSPSGPKLSGKASAMQQPCPETNGTARRAVPTLFWTPPERRILCFAAFTLVIGTICYAIFLETLNYYTQPWYYVAYLALAATCVDAIYGAALVAASPLVAQRGRLARIAFVWGFAALMLIQARLDLFTRQTNLDLIGRQLTTATAPGDLVVNSRWECAITFERYYHGAAADLTLPPIIDHRFHRYDLVLQQMMTTAAAQPVLDRLAQTLRAGHRVWLIGPPRMPADGGPAPLLEPARQDAAGEWHLGGNYYDTWAMQAGAILVAHAQTAVRFEVPVPGPVCDYEDLPVSVLAGWH